MYKWAVAIQNETHTAENENLLISYFLVVSLQVHIANLSSFDSRASMSIRLCAWVKYMS